MGGRVLTGRSVTTLNDIHVLVVDDNKQMRFLVRCLLRAGGITKVTEAETGSQAFDVMRARPVDLIIVDWKMAPIDGLRFTQMVRRNSDSPNPYVPILMLTAHTEISRVAAARDAGVNGFVKGRVRAHQGFHAEGRDDVGALENVAGPHQAQRAQRGAKHEFDRHLPAFP